MHAERRVETRGRSRLRTGDKVRINSALIPRLAAAAPRGKRDQRARAPRLSGETSHSKTSLGHERSVDRSRSGESSFLANARELFPRNVRSYWLNRSGETAEG